MDDFRLYINPQPRKGRFSAAWQREPMPAGDEYVEDKHGKQIETLIRSVRPDSVVVVRKLWCLAPWGGSATVRKRELARRMDAIHAAGGCVMDAETGERTAKGNCIQLAAEAILDIQNAGRRQKKAGAGRPRKDRTEAELAIMRAEYFSRKHSSAKAAIVAMEAQGVKKVNPTELNRRFGPRNDS